MLLQMALFHSFLWLNSIPLCVCVRVCIYIYIPIIYQWILAIVNSAAINIGVHVSFQIIVLSNYKYMPRSGIAGSYGNSVFNFLRLGHLFFWS